MPDNGSLVELQQANFALPGKNLCNINTPDQCKVLDDVTFKVPNGKKDFFQIVFQHFGGFYK